MQIFKINKNLDAVCEHQNTRNGFRHIGTLLRDGQEIGSAKCTYLNRTWERYQFESVLNRLLEESAPSLSAGECLHFRRAIQAGDRYRAHRGLKTIAMVAKMGKLFHAGDQKASNDWKARMLKAGLENQGLIMPDDWESLSEDEKELRLNGAIGELAK